MPKSAYCHEYLVKYGTDVKWSDTFAIVKVKVKFTLEQATKAQRGSRGRPLTYLLTYSMEQSPSWEANQ